MDEGEFVVVGEVWVCVDVGGVVVGCLVGVVDVGGVVGEGGVGEGVV